MGILDMDQAKAGFGNSWATIFWAVARSTSLREASKSQLRWKALDRASASVRRGAVRVVELVPVVPVGRRIGWEKAPICPEYQRAKEYLLQCFNHTLARFVNIVELNGAGRETCAVVRQEPAAIGASAATRSPFPVCQHRRSGVKRVERLRLSHKRSCAPPSPPSGFRWQAQRPLRPENEWGSFSTDSALNPYLETRRTSGTALAIPVPSWPRPRQTGKRRANHGRPCEENIQIWKGSDHAW